VHFRSAEIFGGSFLADRGLHQRRVLREKPRAIGHQDVIAHHGEIRTTGNAHAHDGGDLRYAHRAHHRVVAKHAAEIVGIRKNVFWSGKKTPAESTR